MNKRTVGTEYELLAEGYLKERKVRIIKRNFRVRSGEIDLIGYDGQTLVFFEVKYRRTKGYGSAKGAVDQRKQIQICKVAEYYLSFFRVPERIQKRFDVISIQKDEIEWIQNAFPYQRGNR